VRLRAVRGVLGVLTRGALTVACALASAGCDQGKQHDLRRVGPPVHVVATNFGDGKLVPANGSVVLAFDRVLDPATVNRQAAVVVEVGGRPVGNPSVAYDPVTRVLSLSSPNARGTRWLTPGQPYEVLLTDANEKDTIGGVRAVDGAAIDRASPRLLAFFAGPETDDDRARGFDPEIDFCRDVAPMFLAKCSESTCHGSPQAGAAAASGPAEGLLLDTSIGIAQTALRRAAQESNTGARAGLGSSPGRLFGVDMPIIDPGSPASSWLMYKLMMAAPREPFAPPPDSALDASSPDATSPDAAGLDASPSAPTPLPAGGDAGAEAGSTGAAPTSACDGSLPRPAPLVLGAPLAPFAPIDEEERSRFSESMLGSPMPYPDPTGRSNALGYEELERVRAWIAQGAKMTECACLH
jgi:hypothetical protein